MHLTPAQLSNYYNLGSSETKSTQPGSLSFLVPHYQRPYKWKSENIKKFIGDLHREVDRPDSGDRRYFAGAMVSFNPGSLDQPIHLIDGQQRFTTLFLMNFVQFILLREIVAQNLSHGHSDTALLEKLKYSFQYIFAVWNKKDAILELLDSLKSYYSEIPDKQNKASWERQREDLLAQYKTVFGFVDPKNEEHSNFNKFFSSRELRLRYARTKYSVDLKNALAIVKVSFESNGTETNPVFKTEKVESVVGSQNEKTLVEQFVDAIECIFDEFKRISEKDKKNRKVRQVSHGMVDRIDEFLEKVNICQIETRNEDDAYTLFEVLNDRGIDLEDLDLVKNLHFKRFATTTTENEQTSKILDELDAVWGDVYKYEIPEFKKELIAGIASFYISGDKSLGKAKGNQFRKGIDRVLQKREKYGEEDIKDDFFIHQLADHFVQQLGLKAKKASEGALTALVKHQDSSAFSKICWLLWALSYKEVLAGLANLLFFRAHQVHREIRDRTKREEKIRQFVDKAISSDDRELYKDLDSTAVRIGLVALRDVDYKKAKSVSDFYLKHFSMAAFQKNPEAPFTRDSNKTPETIEWLGKWRYDNKTPSEDFKVKWLFLALLLTHKSKNGGQEILQKPGKGLSTLNLDPSQLNLDHFEPDKPRQDNLTTYFDPDSKKRDQLVNEIGNMVPLSKRDNVEKSNMCVDEFLTNPPKRYADEPIKTHWLVAELKDYAIKHSEQDKNGKTVLVEKFFDARKERMIKLMNAISSCAFLLDEEVKV